MIHGLFDKLARALAILGGFVLTALIVLTCLSILGRSANTALHGGIHAVAPDLANALLAAGIGPIDGDYELVEAGIAFSIFAFLPLCQLRGGHASVDIFTAALPPPVNRVLRAVIEIVFALVLVMIAWQLFLGTESKRMSGQTTFLLQFPVWWAYALGLIGAVAAALVAIYVAVMRVGEAVRGRALLPSQGVAEH